MVKMTSRVKRSESLLPNRQRTLVQRLGLRVLARVVVKCRQVVEVDGNATVFRAQDLLVNRQRALIERLGLGVAALGVQMTREPRACPSVSASLWFGGLRPRYA